MGDFLLPPVTLLEAIGDLPPVLPGEDQGLAIDYFREPFSHYQRIIRKGSSIATDHVVGKRDISACYHKADANVPPVGLIPRTSQSAV